MLQKFPYYAICPKYASIILQLNAQLEYFITLMKALINYSNRTTPRINYFNSIVDYAVVIVMHNLCLRSLSQHNFFA